MSGKDGCSLFPRLLAFAAFRPCLAAVCRILRPPLNGVAAFELVRRLELDRLALDVVAARVHPTLAVVADFELRVARLLLAQRDAVEEVFLALRIVGVN